MPSLSFLSLSKYVVTKTVMAHVSQHSYLLELLSRDFVVTEISESLQKFMTVLQRDRKSKTIFYYLSNA